MNIYDQLQAVEDRYEELGELLSDPDVVSDTKRFMELSKEEASTRDTVTAYREYKQVLQNIKIIFHCNISQFNSHSCSPG